MKVKDQMISNIKSKITIIERPESMSLKTLNGTFTMGYNGERASGNLASHPTAFKEMTRFVNEQVKFKKNFGEAFRMLGDTNTLSKFWPEWNEVEINPFKADGSERVRIVDEKYNKKYGEGLVIGIKNLNVVVKFDSQPGSIQMDFKMVQKIESLNVSVVEGSVSEIAGGRGFAIHHDNCSKSVKGISLPPMRKGKMPKEGSKIVCDCGASVHVKSATSIWD